MSAATAFQKIQSGIDCLSVPGDQLFIFGGTYTEFVTVTGKNGTPDKPIVIEGEPAPGLFVVPTVRIQASITTLTNSMDTFAFHTAPNEEWDPVPGAHGDAPHYVSKKTLPKPANIGIDDWNVNRGAFVSQVNGRHTQLISYSRREDLLAQNETDEAICESPTYPSFPTDSRPGPILPTADACKAQGCADCQQRRPWVYMGPGLWFDQGTQLVHIRLSPTHNGVPGLADYAGETDPNKVALSITEKNMKPLTVKTSSSLSEKSLGSTIVHLSAYAAASD